jgi:NAD(P)-dependent dehydrogenase (short-subunit alcohol dehydrogenase family)
MRRLVQTGVPPAASDVFIGWRPATGRGHIQVDGRLSKPEDMGAPAAYPCSDDAAMVTGIALEVDGGRCI